MLGWNISKKIFCQIAFEESQILDQKDFEKHVKEWSNLFFFKLKQVTKNIRSNKGSKNCVAKHLFFLENVKWKNIMGEKSHFNLKTCKSQNI